MRGNENGEMGGCCEPRGSIREGLLAEVMSSWGPGGQEASDQPGVRVEISNSREGSWSQQEEDTRHQGPAVPIRR